MTQQPAQPTPIRDVDALAGLAVDLQDQIAQLGDQLKNVKAQLDEQLGEGDHKTTSGIKVKVQGPNRKFNPDKAWLLLKPEQQAVCMSRDVAKVKGQLPQVLIDACMDPGTGANIVKVG